MNHRSFLWACVLIAVPGCSSPFGLGQVGACSCEQVSSNSTCVEIHGPSDRLDTYESLCEELSTTCEGTYAETACPNEDRLAICTLPQTNGFSESLVLYASGGAPIHHDAQIDAACETYGAPEYY